jgi:hypothetical protein
VHALLGEKEYALPERSSFVLSSVQNILDYTLRADSLSRFDGIHFDIEPHLLPDFKTRRRDSVLQNYLSIISRSADLIHASGLIAGADMPFWFDALTDSSNRPLLIPFNGASKPVYQHVIDIVDQTVLMDYRTTSVGANGAVALAADEVLYAAQANKKISIGLETGLLPDEHMLVIRGPAENGLNAWNVGDLNIIMIAGADSVTAYLMPDENFDAFERQLSSNRISKERIFHWPVRRNVLIPSTNLTFAKLGYQPFQIMAAEVEKEFLPFSSFAGIAIHHYESYKKLRDAALR